MCKFTLDKAAPSLYGQQSEGNPLSYLALLYIEIGESQEAIKCAQPLWRRGMILVTVTGKKNHFSALPSLNQSGDSEEADLYSEGALVIFEEIESQLLPANHTPC